MTLASGFPAVAPRCAGPAGPEISKAVARSSEKNTKHRHTDVANKEPCWWRRIASAVAGRGLAIGPGREAPRRPW